ncbi:MAG: hypothetical protein IPK16_01170 [Anaerolineales bacterium]|nr:hypothetical protein [Anaerolineales bacterium]
MANVYILPEHIWRRLNFSTISEFNNGDMIGSGPFRLTRFLPGAFAQLTPFKHYYHPRSHLEGIEFQTFDNFPTMSEAISSGTVDLLIGFSAPATKALAGIPNVALEVGAPAEPLVSTVLLNVADPAKCPAAGDCTGHPALRSLAVRQALAHATNKQQIIDELLDGTGTPGMTLIPAGYGIWYNRQIRDFAYNIARANLLLETAGYRDLNGDGVREMPGGQRSLVFRLSWPSDNAEAAQLAALLSQEWAKIGIRTEPAAIKPDALTTIASPAFAYDIIVWGSGVLQDPSTLLKVMTTGQLANGVNETGYSNPEYDALYRLQASELDLQKRQQMIWRMQEIAHNDTPYIIPYYTETVEAYRTDRFTGWTLNQGRVALEDFSSIMRLRLCHTDHNALITQIALGIDARLAHNCARSCQGF